jgi:thiamine-phosphate pyrophosphorylase
MADRARLYLITPPAFALEDFATDVTKALSGGDVAAFQLRMKDAPDSDVLRAGERLMPIVQSFDAAFILNDRPDLARKLGADGVHVGQEDAPYAEARKIMGADAIVGVTCHDSRHLAMVAGEAGADYVAFGAFYPTSTKDASTRAEPEILEWWQANFTVPCVAIGGIKVEHAEELARAGADFLAVANGVWAHPQGPAEAVRLFNAAFDRAQEA